MHQPRKRSFPPTSRAARRLFTGAAALSAVLFGLTAPAYAATPGQAKPVKSDVVALCGTPKKGEAACFGLRRADVNAGRGVRPAVTVPGFGPDDLRAAYQLPAGGGTGQTVAIVDAFDNPRAEADLAVYRQQFGLPECSTANGCLRKVDQRGGTSYPAPDTGWGSEISLDLDMVSAIAPQAHLLLVEADTPLFTDLAAAEDTAVALGAKFVSNSYGSSYTSAPGSGEDPSFPTDLDPHYNHPGVAVVASTGDNNFGVSYPASSTYVTSVGGTSLVRDSSTRGFHESVWSNSFGGPGSGCSTVEAKPRFQTDTGCDKRMVADVSAVADPATGVSVYDSFGGSGWSVYGGTSASAPIVTGVFASAGTPASGTYPNSYPYAHPGALNDVTQGSNGSCSTAYFCTAGTGYDGPTGLGTPDGLVAFAAGPHGDIAGTVTNSGTGAPIAGARVSAGDSTELTDAQGHYDLGVPAGGHDVSASAFGFRTGTATVSVADGATVTQNFALAPVPSATVSGRITDGSGHGWPLYAAITVDGVPGGPVFTDPYTGRYRLQLPQGSTYQLHVAANYAGYQALSVAVPVGTGDVTRNLAVPVDTVACDARGYQLHFAGTTESFDSASAPAGWSVSNANANGGWVFNDPKPRGNLTGGSGGFAIIDSDYIGQNLTEDTTLTSPAFDLTGVAAPDLSFNTDYHGYVNSTADVEVSVNGGATWTNVWHHSDDNVRGPAHVDIPLAQAAGQKAVQVRFRYTGTWAWWWELDDVFMGSRTCDPVAGGLVAGEVTDANTKAGVTGAVVSSVDNPADAATTSATPDDPNLGDGFYSMFSPLTGAHPFTASKARYTPLTKTKTVVANDVTKTSFALTAGRIKVSPAAISKTLAWGGSTTATLTVTNNGTAPARLDISESSGGAQVLSRTGAPLHQVAGKYSGHSMRSLRAASPNRTAAPADATPADAPWTTIADYPVSIQDNLTAVDSGWLYSAFGFNGSGDVSDLYAYDTESGAWSKLASAADTREKPAGGFIGGKLYVAGGWGATGAPDPKLEIYTPASNTWSTGPADPKPYAGAGSAVLNGKLYLVGGCASSCGTTDVMLFNPAAGTWSQLAPYPEATSWVSCGAIGTRIYCAGGLNEGNSGSRHAFSYDPVTNIWSPVADLPLDLWGSAYTVAGGKLLISGGAALGSSVVTNQGYAYDPATDAWAALPNANNAAYRGAGTCGFYKVGGNPGGSSTAPPLARAEVLPGMTACGAVPDVGWLSESPTTVTLQPGASTKVAVTLDASAAEVTQPGTYTAQLAFVTNTPYPLSPVDVTMVVQPPKTWGKITGTVTGPDGTPIAGATVQIDTWANSYTLKTDRNGQYALWLDVRNNPLQVIAAKDGYQPQVKTVKIAKGKTTTLGFTLKKAP
ncbi:MAG TPA: carboxypeptidase regulatory-like domain-containing protein [Rugosimonospora sp.]|nr:carboxypeptidase regulatory-like domain-containing protein [Rugosimonospora sp.]